MKSKLILGTVQFGKKYGINSFGRPNNEHIFSILNCAFKNKIRTLDTAEDYGESQKIIGKFIKKNPKKNFKIISKLSSKKKIKKNELYDRICKCTEIMNVKKLDSFMIHDYKSFKKKNFLSEEIVEVKNLGQIDKIGISLYDNKSIYDIIENYPFFDFIQIPFNLLDNESKRGKVIDLSISKKIKVHVRSVFLQGLFFKNISELDSSLSKLKPYLITLDRISKKNSLKLYELALKYVLSKKFIDKIVIGVDTIEQFKKNIKVLSNKNKVPIQEIEKINVLENKLLNPTNWI